MENNEIAVSARKLKKIYKLYAEEIVALKEIDFEIPRGQFVSVMGPSGAGKTTLLNLIGCLDSVTSGSLAVLGHDVRTTGEKQRRVLPRGESPSSLRRTTWSLQTRLSELSTCRTAG
jgi:putative ABC transport system ATP-binding protein